MVSRILFWYSWAYLQVQTYSDCHLELAAVRDRFRIFLQAYSRGQL